MEADVVNPDVVSNIADLAAFLFVTPEIAHKIRGQVRSWLIVLELLGVVVGTLLLMVWLAPFLQLHGVNPLASILISIAVYALAMFGLCRFVDRRREEVEKGPTRVAHALFGIGAGLFLTARIINVLHALHLWA